MEFEGNEADWAEEFFGDSKREVPLWLYEVIEVAYAISLIMFISSLGGLVWIYIDIEAGVTSTMIIAGLITSVLGLTIFGRLKSTRKGVSKKMLEHQCDDQ